MEKRKRGLLIGMGLGDGHINVRVRTRGDSQWISSELRVLHSLAQKDYCEHKCGLVNKSLKRNSTVRIVKNGPEKKYKAAHFTTSHPYFKFLKKVLYPGGKKTITRRMLDMLTDEGIAIWYMDDGSCRFNINVKGRVSSVSTSIATMCRKEEVLLIINYFLETYGIEFKSRCKKTSDVEYAFYIECNTENSRKFVKLVEPFIIPSMAYKIKHVADLDSHERQAPVGVCSHCGGHIFQRRTKGLCRKCYSLKYYASHRRFVEGRKPKPKRSGDEIVWTNENEIVRSAG